MSRTHRSLRWSFLIVTLLVEQIFHTALALPVIPNAVGYGIDTPAGRRGRIIKVTNLADSGPGSLREALRATGPRIVVFETSGLLTLNQEILISSPNITIAGQTAPAPGITINGKITIGASDVLIQHLAIRPDHNCNPVPGSQNSCLNRDAVPVGGQAAISNIVLDHVSLSYGTDELFSVWSDSSPVTNVTIRNSIIADALYREEADRPSYEECETVNGSQVCRTVHVGFAGYGALPGRNASNIALLNNVLARNHARNPLIRDTANHVVVLNNLIYRPGPDNTTRIYFGTKNDNDVRPLRARVENNTLVLAPNSNHHTGIKILSNTTPDLKIFLSANRLYDPDSSAWRPSNNDPWDPSLVVNERTLAVKADTDPTTPHLNAQLITTDFERTVLRNAGVRPGQRDPLDQDLVAEIDKCTPSPQIPNPGTANGCPTASPVFGSAVYKPLAVNHHTLNLPAQDDGTDSNGNGYTDIEEWLQARASEVEGSGAIDPAATFVDDFENGSISQWQPVGDPAIWSAANGSSGKVLRLSDSTQEARILRTGTNWTNQAIQADIKPTTYGSSPTAWFGLMARYKDPANYYYVLVMNTGAIELKSIVNGGFTALATGSMPAAPPLNKTYRLRLEAIGTSLKMYVDDRLVLQATDSAHASGRAGVMTWKTAADIDNVRVSQTGQSTLLTEDFQDGVANGWLATGTSSWAVVDDGGSKVYRQSNTTGDARSVVGTATWTDQVINVDAKLNAFNATGLGWFGLMARYQDPANFYYLVVQRDGLVELKKIVANSYSTLSTGSFTPLPGSTYKLRLEAVGSQIKAYVDNQLVLQATDATFAAGKVGATMWKADVSYDNVLVTRP